MPGNVTDGRFGMGHPSNTKWHWPRPINMPNCNSIHPVVFAQGSGDLASCLVTMSTVHGCDRHTDMTMKKTRCSTEVTQRKMNRLINSGKRVDGVDRFSAESSRSTESSKVESIDFHSSGVDSFDSIDFKDCHHNLSYIAKYEHDSCHMHCNSQYERALFRLMKMNHSFFCMSYSAGALFTPAVIRQSWGSKR